MADFVFNRFIWKRGMQRGLAHWLIMWGTAIGAGHHLSPGVRLGPLQALHRERPGRLPRQRVRLRRGRVRDALWFGFFIFHGLVWSSLLVVAGVLLALRRRLRDQGVARFSSSARTSCR